MAVFYITLVFMIIPVTFGVSNIIAGLIADVLVSQTMSSVYVIIYNYLMIETLKYLCDCVWTTGGCSGRVCDCNRRLYRSMVSCCDGPVLLHWLLS